MDATTQQSAYKKVQLLRACPAMLIPSGVKLEIAKDTEVIVTHRLGGNFTVSGPFGLARIEGLDADALGESVPDSLPKKPAPQEAAADAPFAQKFPAPENSDLWDVVKTVFDPEIPVNVVDLGLIYRLEVIEGKDGKRCAQVDMTLTAPGCSMGPMIAEDVRLRLEAVPGIDSAVVNIVWDPPWNQDMISLEGKMVLGLI